MPYAPGMRILVTGAGRAIGAATAAELARSGHHVVATARDVDLLAELDVAVRLPLDVTDDASVAAALAQAGELDAIVNNAGLSGKGPLESFPIERLRAMFETNTFGPLRLLQHVLPAWRRRGSGVVVNVSSVQGRVATPLEGSYSASKFALEGMSETLHYELGHFGIRVVVIEPGYIAPGMKPVEGIPGDPIYAGLWDQWEGTDDKVTGPGGRPGPELVAVAIRRAIEDPDTPLRVPVGDDAVAILEARAQLDDATFESAMRQTLGMTW
jgi:NAD(P)-dependent dehydrogenase (short-subunit alcohol dehydrogenase family)